MEILYLWNYIFYALIDFTQTTNDKIIKYTSVLKIKPAFLNLSKKDKLSQIY